MSDRYAKYYGNLESPASGGVTVTPNDSANLTSFTRTLYVGGGGDVRLETVDGSELLFKAVPTGTVLPVRTRKVFATNTTANNILGLY